MSRLGWDGDERIYFDTSKPWNEEGERGPLYEEADPIEVCDELERDIAKLQAALNASERENGKLRLVVDPAHKLIGAAIAHRHVNHGEWVEAARLWLLRMPYPAGSKEA